MVSFTNISWDNWWHNWFFVLRNDAPKMARNCLIIGIITIAIGIGLSAAGSLATLNVMTDAVIP